MNFRRAAEGDYLDGVEIESLRGVFQTMERTDIWINLGA
jgi:hypothetical protein